MMPGFWPRKRLGAVAAPLDPEPATAPRDAASRRRRTPPAVVIVGLGLVALLALARRPAEDLANYMRLVEVVGDCSTLTCVLGAADKIEEGVLRDPYFNILLVPFMGQARLAVITLTVVTYAAIVAAMMKFATEAGFGGGSLMAAYFFSWTLAVLPVTLATHLLRQSFATGLFLFLYVIFPKRLCLLLGTALALVHKGAAGISLLTTIVPPALLGASLLLGGAYMDALLSRDTIEYATTTGRSSIELVPPFAAISILAYLALRRTSKKASRLLLNVPLLLVAMSWTLGQESVAVTRTFISCLLLTLPGLALLFLLSIRALDSRSRGIVLAVATGLLLCAGVLREFASPFSYDFPDLFH